MVTTDEVRSLALCLPEAEEHDHWGKPAFRVRSKLFAVIQPDGVSLGIKTTIDERTAYTTLDPEVFQMPESFVNLAYMVVRLDRIDPDEFHGLLIRAWRLAAPKKLVKAYNESIVEKEA